MTELPRGWATAPLGELALNRDRERIPVNAKDRSARVGGVPYYGAAGQVGWIDEVLFSETLLLLGEDGVQFFDADKPKAYLVGGPAWVNNHAHVLSQRRGVDLRYLMHFLNQFDYHGYANGTTRLKLTRSSMDEIPVRLAPEAEQERIVVAVEEAFSKLDAGEAGLRNVRQLLKCMRGAVLAAAVTGRLVPQDPTDTPATKLLADLGVEVSDAPNDESVPHSWTWALLGDVSSIGGGIQKQPKRAPVENASPFLRVANVGRGRLDLGDVHQIELFDGELTRYGLAPGDLLVVEGNGSPDQIGRSAIWHGEIDPCVHQNHLIRVRPSEAVDPAYLELYWNSPSASRRVQAVASSTSGLHTLSTGKLRGLPVALPPLDEQTRIVTEVERQMSFIKACERPIGAGLQQSAALRRSVLKAAFEGRLVPQDPADEPAPVLLARMRAERAAAPKAKSRRARTTA